MYGAGFTDIVRSFWMPSWERTSRRRRLLNSKFLGGYSSPMMTQRHNRTACWLGSGILGPRPSFWVRLLADLAWTYFAIEYIDIASEPYIRLILFPSDPVAPEITLLNNYTLGAVLAVHIEIRKSCRAAPAVGLADKVRTDSETAVHHEGFSGKTKESDTSSRAGCKQ